MFDFKITVEIGARDYALTCDSLQTFTWKDTATKKKYSSYTYNTEKALPTADDVSRNGYRLEGWYKDWSYTDGPYSVVEAGTLEDVTFYAKWETDANNAFYPIQASANDGGKVSVSCKEAKAGTTVSFNLTPNTGYEINTAFNPYVAYYNQSYDYVKLTPTKTAMTKSYAKYKFQMPNAYISTKAPTTVYIRAFNVSEGTDAFKVATYNITYDANGGEDIDLIAKIENSSGVKNLESIVKASDGIMVARGDLGVELPYETIPNVQKRMIDVCRILGKRCITATEMLESMIHSPRPTRAEISDVANAVYDGTSAVMLSGETAAGEYPVEAVKAMAKIVEQAEKYDEYLQVISEDQFVISSPVQALSHSACTLAKDLHAKAIVVCTHTGMTARMVSRFRPRIPIIGLTTSDKAFRKLALSWGVVPMMIDNFDSVDVLFYFAKDAARKSGLVKKGERVVLTGGTPTGKGGNTSLISIDVL